MGYTVNEMIKPQTDWLTHVADVKRVGYGEKAAFRTKLEGVTAFIQAKGATPARSKIAHKQVTLDTIAVSARPVINVYELRTGRVQMSDLIRDASYEMHVKQIQHWMRTGAVTVLGDIAIISKLADQTGFTAATSTQQFAPSIIEEVIRTGVVGVYYGAKVVNLVNPYLSDNVTPIIDTKRLYILPSAASVDMRPLKVLYEGDVQSTESTNIDDLAYEVRLDQWFGAGVVTGKTPAMSVYVDSST